jgi:hypothetical protein
MAQSTAEKCMGEDPSLNHQGALSLAHQAIASIPEESAPQMTTTRLGRPVQRNGCPATWTSRRPVNDHICLVDECSWGLGRVHCDAQCLAPVSF